jgi:hypothetical protein
VIEEVTRFKQNKVIHFEDFNEIIATVKEEKNYDFLASVHHDEHRNRFLKLLTSNIDQFI